jgi:methionyl-tRNA synthetase
VNWFFRLSKYQQPLHYADNPSFIELKSGATRSWVRRRRPEDISMSRAGSRGASRAVRSHERGHVWFDALINYAAAVGYGWDDERFAKWWPANLHVVGKDITRFHCVIWPAMLMSAPSAARAGVRSRLVPRASA